MATNPFDQFDASQANPFDQFDATQKSSGILGPIRGAIEAGAGLISGMVTAPIVEGAKIYGTLTSGKYGTPEGIRAGEQVCKAYLFPYWLILEKVWRLQLAQPR